MASDFLSWDDDLDLDILLEEYTDNEIFDQDCESDSDFNAPDAKRPRVTNEKSVDKNLNDSTVYECPICQKHLRSISGFRGHTSKQHGKHQLKASDHKLKNAISTVTEIPVNTAEVGNVFTQEDTFFPFIGGFSKEDTGRSIKQFVWAIWCSDSCKVCSKLCCCRELFFQNILKLFSNNVNLCLTLDREVFFKKLHVLRVDVNIENEVCELLSREGYTFSIRDVNSFVQLLLLEIIEQLLILQVRHYKSISDQKQSVLTDQDQSILFYITGYIIRALKKKYSRFNSGASKLSCVEKLLCKSDQCTFLDKFKKWSEKKNRGGLSFPSDEFYLLIREMEMRVRSNVDINSLSSDSLNCEKLREKIMESFMVKYYMDKIFSDEDTSLCTIVIEDITCLFLRVRGIALVRVERNNLHKQNLSGARSKKSESLRQLIKVKQ